VVKDRQNEKIESFLETLSFNRVGFEQFGLFGVQGIGIQAFGLVPKRRNESPGIFIPREKRPDVFKR
jgi:hypothetical protein